MDLDIYVKNFLRAILTGLLCFIMFHCSFRKHNDINSGSMSESIANGVFVNEYVVIADTLFTYSGQKPSRLAIKECFGEQAYGYEDYSGFRRFNKKKYDGRFNIILTCEPEIWPGFSVDFLYNSNETSSKNLEELPDTLTVTITTWKDDRVYERFKLKKKT